MKRLLLGAFIIVGLYFFGTPAHALKVDVLSTNPETSTSVFQLYALPPKETTAVKVRLSLTGGVIESVQVADDKILALPACDNKSSHTENQVCVELAYQGAIPFQTDQGILLITVTHALEEEPVFTANPDFAYLSTENELVAEDGTILSTKTPAVGEITPAPTVDTTEQTTDTNTLPFFLLIGILIVLVGAFVAIIFYSEKKSKTN